MEGTGSRATNSSVSLWDPTRTSSRSSHRLSVWSRPASQRRQFGPSATLSDSPRAHIVAENGRAERTALLSSLFVPPLHRSGAAPIAANPALRHHEVGTGPCGVKHMRVEPSQSGVRPHGRGLLEPSRSELVARVLGSFREMPGLTVRVDEAARLLGLSEHTCYVLLEELVERGLLRRTASRYVSC